MAGPANSTPIRGGSGWTRSAPRAAVVQSLRLSDGRALCVRQWPGAGPGAGTVVLLHGLLDSSEGWAPLAEGLSCRLIAFDVPGFGYSDAPPRGSIDQYARDVADGLAKLGVERFTLVGHSLGGAVATAVAELLPAQVTALVLLAPAGFGRIGLAELVSIPGVRDLVQTLLPFALSSRLAVTAAYMTMVANGAAPEPELVSRLTERGASLVDGAREGTRAVVDAGRSRLAFHRRRVDYDGPVFAVWGGRDRLVPVSHRRGVRVAFPHAHIDVWPEMGHHPLRERFEDLRELITRAA
jgi:pimeloyl-ACP methyl ester carboxylesterase